MGHRFIDDKAAERDSEEEYDQDDNNPLCKFLFRHFNPLPSSQISEYMRGGMEENGVNTVFHQGKSSGVFRITLHEHSNFGINLSF